VADHPLTGITGAVAALGTVPLDVLRPNELFDRTDTKYLLPIGLTADIVTACADSYRAVLVRGTRLCHYRTEYYDDDRLRLYHAHHAGQRPRHKVRVRTYLDTGDRFLELKSKTNTDRTRKSRLPLSGVTRPPFDQLAVLPTFDPLRVPPPAALCLSLVAEYTRITLVSCDRPERVTIDFDLSFHCPDRDASFPGIAIAELKQKRYQSSAFQALMRARRIRPGAISKYCLGITALYGQVLRNRYWPVIRHIQKVSHADVGLAAVG